MEADMDIDISDIARKNHDYAIHLATLQGVLRYEKGIFEISNLKNLTPYETVDFWRDISLAAELLLKASLLKHEIAFFKKRAHAEYGKKVTAANNPWLEKTLKQMEIDYIAQINTGTISTALRSAEADLFEKISLDNYSATLISKTLYIIIRTRRNRNNHFFFPNQSQIDPSDVEILYLPLLNKLEEIYQLEL